MGKKATRRKTKVQFYQRKLATRIVFIAVIVFGVSLWLVSSGTLQHNRQQALQQWADVWINDARLYDDAVYREVEDKGCGEVLDSTKKLLYDAFCQYSGLKVVPPKLNLARDLDDIESALQSRGYKQSGTGFGAIDTSRQYSSRIYYKTLGNDESVVHTISVFYLKYNATHTDRPELNRLIEEKKLKVPAGKEYVYGILFDTRFYTCNNRATRSCPGLLDN